MPYLINICFLILSIFSSFSQNKVGNIGYLYDQNEIYDQANIISSNSFVPMIKDINNGFKNGIYWFKISDINSEKSTIQIANNRINQVVAYQGNNIIPTIKYERFITFKTNRKENIYLKVNVTREALIPISIKNSEDFSKNEKISLLFLGFYIGFTFIIGLINLFYYINFRDLTFLYYTFFIYAQCIGLSISDGVLHFFNFDENTISSIEVLDHSIGVIFSILFTCLYLQTDNYYPKFKKNLFVLNAFALLFALIFIFTGNHIWYVIMELLVFGIFILIWSVACTLFSKNLFIKIFVIAYFFVLIFGILFYITKLFGIPVVINSSILKFGAFLEMVILSFAVAYRMKTLKQKNKEMRKEIISYVQEIENISKSYPKEETITTSKLENGNLTPRETEILSFVVNGKSNKEIAGELNISINTVKYHVKNVYDKLNIKNRNEIQNLAL